MPNEKIIHLSSRHCLSPSRLVFVTLLVVLLHRTFLQWRGRFVCRRVTISTFNQRSIVLHVLAAFDVDVCLILLVRVGNSSPANCINKCKGPCLKQEGTHKKRHIQLPKGGLISFIWGKATKGPNQRWAQMKQWRWSDTVLAAIVFGMSPTEVPHSL